MPSGLRFVAGLICPQAEAEKLRCQTSSGAWRALVRAEHDERRHVGQRVSRLMPDLVSQDAPSRSSSGRTIMSF